ncbi:MAG TPA: c-type cytochrome [Steroidobacteraceae bacterium]|jgi:mono/diheme cytochrome c family protein
MKAHTRHVAIATLIALILLLIATVSARADDFSTYSGARLYSRFCAACHGDKGHGDGLVAASFKIMVPDLTRIAKRHGGEFPEADVRRIIDGTKNVPPHGSREMPVWGFEFYAQAGNDPDPAIATSQMIERLTQYLKSIQAQ